MKRTLLPNVFRILITCDSTAAMADTKAPRREEGVSVSDPQPCWLGSSNYSSNNLDAHYLYNFHGHDHMPGTRHSSSLSREAPNPKQPYFSCTSTYSNLWYTNALCIRLAGSLYLFGGEVEEAVVPLDGQKRLGLVEAHRSAQPAVELEHHRLWEVCLAPPVEGTPSESAAVVNAARFASKLGQARLGKQGCASEAVQARLCKQGCPSKAVQARLCRQAITQHQQHKKNGRTDGRTNGRTNEHDYAVYIITAGKPRDHSDYHLAQPRGTCTDNADARK